MNERGKRRLILLAGSIAVIALILIGLALGSTERGLPRPALSNDPGTGGTSVNYSTINLQLVIQVLFLLGIIAFLATLIKRPLKQIIAWLLAIFFIGVVVFGLFQILQFKPPQNDANPVPPVLPDMAPEKSDLQAADPRAKALYTFMIIGLLVTGLVVTAGVVSWIAAKKRKSAPSEEDALRREIGTAFDSAASRMMTGESPRQVILRCYLALSKVLEKRKNLIRRDWESGREFIGSLVNIGFPAAEVAVFLELFERARYSDAELTDDDRNAALSALKTLVGAGISGGPND